MRQTKIPSATHAFFKGIIVKGNANSLIQDLNSKCWFYFLWWLTLYCVYVWLKLIPGRSDTSFLWSLSCKIYIPLLVNSQFYLPSYTLVWISWKDSFKLECWFSGLFDLSDLIACWKRSFFAKFLTYINLCHNELWWVNKHQGDIYIYIYMCVCVCVCVCVIREREETTAE